MGANSKIQWCHHTFNPWWGCAKVSPGCAHCYAETLSKRWGNEIWGKDAPRKFFGEKHWQEPRKWNAAAEKAGTRARVFCASMADVFEEREDLNAARCRLFDLIYYTPHLDWLILTKRPDFMRDWMLGTSGGGAEHLWAFENVWFGTSAEDQARWFERVPVLMSIPARIRFVSVEPLLGPIVLPPNEQLPEWVIVGGESGPRCRPMKKEWVTTLRDQCAGRAAFFFKQWGGVSKKEPVALLDGQLHQEFPS